MSIEAKLCCQWKEGLGGVGGKPGGSSWTGGTWFLGPAVWFLPFPAPISPTEACPLSLESTGLLHRSRQYVCALGLGCCQTLGVSVRASSPVWATQHGPKEEGARHASIYNWLNVKSLLSGVCLTYFSVLICIKSVTLIKMTSRVFVVVAFQQLQCTHYRVLAKRTVMMLWCWIPYY